MECTLRSENRSDEHQKWVETAVNHISEVEPVERNNDCGLARPYEELGRSSEYSAVRQSMQWPVFHWNYGRKSILAAFLLTSITFGMIFPLRAVTGEGYLNKSFEWYYKGLRWTWSMSIPQSTYDTYKSVPISDRIKNGVAGYDFLVTTQDNFVIQTANKLHEAATQKGCGAYDEVSFVLAFVQSLPYTRDSVTAGFDEYPRFPVETLVDDGGDCEDTSILFAALVLVLNYDAIFVSPPRHCAVGVRGTNLDGYYWTYNSRTYYYCETTSDDYSIGDVPREYNGVSAHLYSIDKNGQYVPGRSFFWSLPS